MGPVCRLVGRAEALGSAHANWHNKRGTIPAPVKLHAAILSSAERLCGRGADGGFRFDSRAPEKALGGQSRRLKTAAELETGANRRGSLLPGLSATAACGAAASPAGKETHPGRPGPIGCLPDWRHLEIPEKERPSGKHRAGKAVPRPRMVGRATKKVLACPARIGTLQTRSCLHKGNTLCAH